MSVRWRIGLVIGVVLLVAGVGYLLLRDKGDGPPRPAGPTDTPESAIDVTRFAEPDALPAATYRLPVPQLGPKTGPVDLTPSARLEQVDDRLRLGAEPGLLLDRDLRTTLSAGKSIKLVFSFLGRRPVRIASVEVSSRTGTTQGSLVIRGAMFGPTEGYRLLGKASGRMKLQLKKPAVLRFMQLELTGAGPLSIGRVRISGQPVRTASVQLAARRFSATARALSAGRSEPAAGLISGLASGGAQDAVDPLWRSNPAWRLPLDLQIHFPLRRVIVDRLVIDTRLPKVLVGASPRKVELWMGGDAGSLKRVAAFELPGKPAAHELVLAPAGKGYPARLLQLRLLDNHGHALRTAVRELYAYGVIEAGTPPDPVRAGNQTLAVDAVGIHIEARAGESIRIGLAPDRFAPLRLTFTSKQPWQVVLRGAGGDLDLEVGPSGERTVAIAPGAAQRLAVIARALPGKRPARARLRLSPIAPVPGQILGLEPDGTLRNPGRLGGIGRELILESSFLSRGDVDVYSFVAGPEDGRHAFILSRVPGADTWLALLGPDSDEATGLASGARKPETLLRIDEVAQAGREVASGWTAPARGEYFLVIGIKPGSKPGRYRLTIRRRK